MPAGRGGKVENTLEMPVGAAFGAVTDGRAGKVELTVSSIMLGRRSPTPPGRTMLTGAACAPGCNSGGTSAGRRAGNGGRSPGRRLGTGATAGREGPLGTP